jgi:hypothetical protein
VKANGRDNIASLQASNFGPLLDREKICDRCSQSLKTWSMRDDDPMIERHGTQQLSKVLAPQ